MPSPTSADVSSLVSGCTCARLRRLTRRMTALYDRELAPTGLRLTQYSLLATLRREAWDGGVPVTDLASAMDMDRTTLTRNLRPLLEQGLVQLGADPEDARVRRASSLRRATQRSQTPCRSGVSPRTSSTTRWAKAMWQPCTSGWTA